LKACLLLKPAVNLIVTLGKGNLVMKDGAWKLGDAAHTELVNKVS
jgi:hypothetical protein